MKIFKKMKDGGNESTVTGYWLIEWKSVFSIVLLKFEGESRDMLHTHAFNCVSWVVKGFLSELIYPAADINSWSILIPHASSWKPFITKRETLHKVSSEGTSWVLSFRGPWKTHWKEWNPNTNEVTLLTNGRKPYVRDK